jgi:hypothetical protein
MSANALTATSAEEKNWATACARAALAGHSLRRTDPADGPVGYIVERFGLLRELRVIEDLKTVLGLAA